MTANAANKRAVSWEELEVLVREMRAAREESAAMARCMIPLTPLQSDGDGDNDGE